MRKSVIHEALAALYFRLNGYFTTGLILHNPEWGKARTEVDCLAIRHPYHAQPDRQIKVDNFLGVQENEIDLIVCEVKSCPEELRFNKPIRTDPEVLQNILCWAGVLNSNANMNMIKKLIPLFQGDVSKKDAQAGVVEGMFRVRPLLCCPPCNMSGVDKWCLTKSEIFNFVNYCFNPTVQRESCSTRYNFLLWGQTFTPIVQYFKNLKPGKEASIDGLYEHLVDIDPESSAS